MMTNELTLPELQRAIGEARGYREYERDGRFVWMIPLDSGPPLYMWDNFWMAVCSHDTSDAAFDSDLPKWPTDPAAALELLAEMCEYDLEEYNMLQTPPHVDLSYHPGQGWVVTEQGGPFWYAPTPSEAIARAWWAWKEGQDE